MSYYVYILVSRKDKSLYTGQTDNLQKRFKRHNQGTVKSTKARIPYDLGYFETYPTRAEAMWREWELKKKWNTERKQKLVENFDRSRVVEILGL